MTTDENILSFRAYLPERGNAFSQHKDGLISLRLSVPGGDRSALLEFLDALGVGANAENEVVMRLVVVRENVTRAIAAAPEGVS